MAADRLDLDELLTLPRLSGLVLSPDGHHLVTMVQTPAPDGKKFVGHLWEIDPDGDAPARRLTGSEPGESDPAFLPSGDLVFHSSRPDPEKAPSGDGAGPTPGLWLLDARGGESRLVVKAPFGVGAVAVARTSGHIAWLADATPDRDAAEDEELVDARHKAGVRAMLFDEYPVRFWDHWLGPARPLLHVADPLGSDGAVAERNVGPEPGRALEQVGIALSPDGRALATGWRREMATRPRADLVLFDVETGVRTELAADGAEWQPGAFSPDGRWLVALRYANGSPEEAARVTMVLFDLSTPQPGTRPLAPGLDVWPSGPVWSPDGSAVYFTADRDGRVPVYRVERDNDTVTCLSSVGAFSDLCPSPDGRRVFALRSQIGSPPEVVALLVDVADQQPVPLRGPAAAPRVAGHLDEVRATASDGTPVHAWLVLPDGASSEHPAPLVVFIHGGPLSSWSAWHWRWNPWVLAERGWAVLLPDPALSTGYGQDFIQRGWGRWGAEPADDVLVALDAALQRGDLDADRTAAMGGSFGGYMANWLAGHTDRFRAIVTHASLWHFDQFWGTTDLGPAWEYEFGDPVLDAERYQANSPHLSVDGIRTPLLVIHGEQDHRVPISEALRLWADLRRRDLPAQFLFFPDENHWILKPGNIRVWYETVLAFLATHVLGSPWQRPDLL